MADTPASPDPSRTPEQRKERAEWKWQLALRAFLLVLLIVDLALAAYAYSAGHKNYDGLDNYGYGYYWGGYNVYLFIPIALCILWVLVCLPLSYFLKSRLHPGFAVGFDLVLWLACIVIGSLFLVTSVYANYDLVPPGISGSSSYYYSSYSAINPQGKPDSTSASDSNDSSYTYESNNGTQTTRQKGDVNYLCPYYDSCAEQDRIYAAARTYINVIIAAQVILLICGILHFTLWVWACVDCARYNRNRASTDDYKRARLIAEEMVKDMQARGEIMVVRQTQQPLTIPTNGQSANHESQPASSTSPVLPQMQEVSHSKGKEPVRESSIARYA